MGSGRNSSFDEGDLIPALLADVLVVTHGGLLKELVSHFVDNLGCKLPGGAGNAAGYPQQVSPNTGISKFTISLSEAENDQPRITCLNFHDKDHLINEDVAEASPLFQTDEV